ncbi:hypothetical protein Tco_0417277 [Tanacetum coccineum]
MYPPMTSESSARDSSSGSSTRPSRKRCRSPTPTGFYFTEDSVEEDIDTNVLADIEADATAVEVAVDRDVKAGVDASIGMEVDVGIDVEDEVEDEVESSDKGTMEVRVDVVAGIDIPNGMLMPDAVERLEQVEEVRSLIAGGERASLLEQVASLERSNARLRGTMMMESARADRFRRCMSFMESDLRQICRFCYYDRMRFRRLETFAIMTITRSGMTTEAIKELINQQVVEALAAYEANRATELAVESQSQNRNDDENGNVGGNGNGNGRGNGNKNSGGNGNKNRGGNRNENPNRIDRGVMPVTQRYQVKYAMCTLLNTAFTWWNAHKRTIRVDAAFAMSWRELMKLMTERELMKLMAEVYCPRNEIQRMESELWNLTVKNNDLAAYTQRF